MRRYLTQAELDFIPNAQFKKDHICNLYLQYCDYTDIQGYLSEQLELNPQLLAWIFDDDSLIGRTPFALDPNRYEAFQDFYNSLSIFDD